MKGTKWLSCLLTFALLAGLLVALPVLPEAAAAEGHVVAGTDFEDGGTIYTDPSNKGNSSHYGMYLISEPGTGNTVLSAPEIRMLTWDYPSFIPIPAVDGGWFQMEKDTTYTISFRYKLTKVYSEKFVIGLRFLPLGSDGNPTNPNKRVNNSEWGHGKYQTLVSISKNTSQLEWQTVEAEVTLPADAAGSCLCLNVLGENWGWNGVDSGNGADVFYLDDVSVKDGAQVTLHENNGTEPRLYVVKGDVSDLPTPVLPGAIFEGWYTDEKLMVPATELQDGDEYYAKWNSFAIDFDHYGDLSSSFRTTQSDGAEVQEGAGSDGSKALYMKSCGQTIDNWPAGIYLRNGSDDMQFLAGHKYAVSFDCKYAVKKYARIGIYPASSKTTHEAAFTYTEIDATPTEYTTYTLTFTPKSDTKAYLVFPAHNSQAGECWIDNVRVIDETALLTVTVDGEEVKGYAGDPIPVQSDDTAAAHETVIGVSGTPKHFWKADEIYTKESAQFAVTGASADGKTLYLRYNDLLYLAADGSVKAVAVRNDSSDLAVKKIGVLLGDSADLTVGSATEGELQILDYNNEGSLFAGVAITAGQTARPYVETTDGTILYGEARTPLAGAFGAISRKDAYTPLGDPYSDKVVFTEWDLDEDGTVTDADGVAALRRLLLDGGAEGKGDLTGGGRDICDLVYLNAALKNAPSYSVAE